MKIRNYLLKMAIHRKAKTVMEKMAKEDVQHSTQTNDDEVWFEVVEKQKTRTTGRPTVTPTDRKVSTFNVEKIRKGLAKAPGVVRDELDEIVENNFIEDDPHLNWVADVPEDEFMDSYGIEYLGGGCFRYTYGFRKSAEIPISNPTSLVLKVAENDNDLWANLEEARMWSMVAGTEAAEHFAPVIDVAEDGTWLLMERVDCSEKLPNSEWSETHDELKEYGLVYRDSKGDNYGYDEDGNVVVVDYGYDWDGNEDSE